MEPDCAVSVSDINQLQPLPNMELAGSNLRVKHVERRLHTFHVIRLLALPYESCGSTAR